MAWILYTDGGCAPTNPGPAGWGAVLQSENGEQRMLNGFLGEGTNQIAELCAAINGLRAVPKGEAVRLFSDSQYVIKGISEWRKGWERNGWKNASGKTISNLSLWQELFAEVDARRVQAQWVKGHADDPLNNLADVLASKAIAARASTTAEAAPTPVVIEEKELLEDRVRRLEGALAHLAEHAGALADRELARQVIQEGHTAADALRRIFGEHAPPQRLRPA